MRQVMWLVFASGLIINIICFKRSHLIKTHGDIYDENKTVRNGSKSSNKSSMANDSFHIIHTGPELDVETWKALRKELLGQNGPVKLFLFAYMRGGSSIAGELFNCDPSATMWYEPGDAFFASYHGLCQENLPQHDLYYKNSTRRRLDDAELEAMTNYYTNSLTCNYTNLPPEAMSHYFLTESTAMDGYWRCMSGKRTAGVEINRCARHISDVCSTSTVETSINAKCHLGIAQVANITRNFPQLKEEIEIVQLLRQSSSGDSIVRVYNNSDTLLGFVEHGLCVKQMRQDNAKCLNKAITKCTSDNLRVVQVTRMMMEDLESLILANPDLHVIHYTRDPRGTALSRVAFVAHPHVFDKYNVSTVREAEFLCLRMREDIRQRRLLESKYPGVFTLMTYESLTRDPLGVAKYIYALFNRSPPKSWESFVVKHMNANGAKNSAGFGITVKNATETALKWKTKIPKDQLALVNRICADVIQDLGYQL